jgi:RNA polymerase sigma-70 factor (ECF subfamily)
VCYLRAAMTLQGDAPVDESEDPQRKEIPGDLPDDAVNPRGGRTSKGGADAARERAHDRSLVDRAARGDARAFRELVARHQRRATAVAYGIVRNNEDAREVAQDAFVRVWKHLADFAGQASFSTWLYRIVYNLSIDLLRRRSPGQAVELDERTDLEGAPSELLPYRGETDPFSSVDRSRLVAAMQKALDQLPAYHRTVIVLREVEGLSYEEIAEATSVPKGTVMSRLFHARRKMQVLLHESLGAEAPIPQDHRDGHEED